MAESRLPRLCAHPKNADSIHSPNPDISDAVMFGSVLRTYAMLILSHTFRRIRRTVFQAQRVRTSATGCSPPLRQHDGHCAHVRHVDLLTRALRIRRSHDSSVLRIRKNVLRVQRTELHCRCLSHWALCTRSPNIADAQMSGSEHAILQLLCASGCGFG